MDVDQRYLDFARLAADWFWETDREDRFIYFSVVTSQSGLDLAGFIGRTRRELTPLTGAEGLARLEAIEAVVRARQPFRKMVYRPGRTEEAARWCEISGEPRFDATGAFDGYRGVGRDISTLMEAQRELQAKSNALEAIMRATRDITDSKEREAELERQAALMTTIVSTLDGFVVYDKDKRLAAWNDAFAELVSIDPALLRHGAMARELLIEQARNGEFGPCDPETEADRRLNTFYPTDRAVVTERMRPNGRVIELRRRSIPGGGWATTYVDITARKQAERALQELNATLESRIGERTAALAESERFLRTLLANVPGMVYRCGNDRARTMEFVSDGCRSLLGIEPADLLGGSPTYGELIHPEDYDTVHKVTRRGFKTSQPFEVLYRVRRADGSWRTMWDRARRAGHVRQWREDRRYSSRHHRAQGNRAGAGARSRRSGRCDRQHRQQYDPVGPRRQAGPPYPAPPRADSGCRQILQGRRKIHRHPAGLRRGRRAGRTARRGQGGVPCRAHCHASGCRRHPHDPPLGQRSRAADFPASHAERRHGFSRRRCHRPAQDGRTVARGTAPGGDPRPHWGVAHDLNNYLAAIMGNLDLLAERLHADPRATKWIKGALSGVHRSAELTRSLLAFSRSQRLDPRVVDVGQAIGEVTRLLRRTIGEKIEIDLEVAPNLWPVRIDATQLNVAIVNLATNARDAMPEGGVLTITVRNAPDEAVGKGRGDHVLIEVSDTGAGMQGDILAKAFEPFFSTKGPSHGTGLGLSIVHGFVHQSGGTITLSSTVGKGTTIQILLPRMPRDSTRPAAPPTGADLPRGTENVLIVQDNEEVRAAVGKQLRSLGYRFTAVATGDAAVELLETQAGKFNLVLVDAVIGGIIDGLALGRMVSERWPSLGVVLTTGSAGDTRTMPDETAKEFRLFRESSGLVRVGNGARMHVSGGFRGYP